VNRRRVHPSRRWQRLCDGALAFVIAVGVHGLAGGLLWLGTLDWKPPEPPPVPSFTLVDAAPYVKAEQRERIAEEQARRAAERLEQARAEQRRAERQRQQQADQAQAERQRQALLEQQRQAQLEREAGQVRRADEQRQLERERREREQARLRELEELRRQREQAERERREQEQRLAELARQREQERRQREAEAEAERLRLAREQAEAEQRRATLREEYVATISERVRRNWIRPSLTRPGVECVVEVVQIPGGDIIDQAIGSPCNADGPTRRSILAAVERTAQLPYRGYDDVFEREIRFVFRYDGD